MKTKTNLKAGRLAVNHNHTIVLAKGIRVKTGVKAGRLAVNHNQTLLRAVR